MLELGDAVYERRHPLLDDGRRAVWASFACRTAVLDGHVHACPDGQIERVWYHSCRHRLCPPCAWGQTERWRARQQTRLLACEHDPVICTLPHKLKDLWRAKVEVRSQRLLARVHDTLVALLGAPQDLGARPGIIAT